MKKIVKNPNIPDITPAEVERWLNIWDNNEEYTIPEEAMNRFFFGEGNLNNDIGIILIKCTLVNYFYSTNIFKIYYIAKHILDLSIDESLQEEKLDIVNKIASVSIPNKNGEYRKRSFYSFATKYCSRHKPDVYPIYDSYVVKVLKYCRDIGEFKEGFTEQSLRNYAEFKRVIISFREQYNLTKYSFKQLDMFLWQFGKKYSKELQEKY